MKIGIDCRTILNPAGGERAGVGHYTYYLIKNLLKIDKQNRYVLFFDSRFQNVNEFKQDNVAIRFFPFYQYKKYLPLAYSQMLINAVLLREQLDVFHSPANVLPLLYSRPAVVTMHDLAIYKFPKFFPTKFLDRQTFSTKVLVPRSLNKAAKIIAVSKNTKSDIVEEFGIEENKIEVVYEGVNESSEKSLAKADFDAVRRKYGIKGKYLLFLGVVEPRKNLETLVKAFRNLRLLHDSPLADYQLIIAGAKGWNDKAIYQAIADANAAIMGVPGQRSGQERRSGFDRRRESLRLKQGERRQGEERRLDQAIKHIGYVSAAEKLLLISHAFCFVFPSFYEGFGLPVLEAMSLGAPVVTSNVSSLPELVGSDAGLLVNPEKEAEIADAISQLLTDDGLRESLIISGKKRAEEFSWEKCAAETIAVYESVKKPK